MGTGTIRGVTKVVDNGPDSSRWNLVVVGDGFTASQLGSFSSAVSSFVTILQGVAPFSGTLTWDRINVYRMDVESDESGAINPATCPDGTTPFAGSTSSGASYFDAEYCQSGIDLRRALVVDTAAVSVEVGLLVPDVDVILVLVNHVQPGGTGADGVAVSYLGGIYDGTAIHELGHSAFGLADEYEYYQGCASGETGIDVYAGPEPVNPNITTVTDRATIKWASYIDAATPMPTTVNANPAACDTQPDPMPAGTIGAYDGAGHYHSGLFRPSYDCRMRDADEDEFCQVCLGAIIDGIVIEGSTCFVVTSVYGDPWAPEVVALREWRDSTLAAGGWRGAAMGVANAIYLRVSPTLVRRTETHPTMRRVLRRWLLTPLAHRIRDRQ